MRIDIDGYKLSCLLYADDIALIAENEMELQSLLSCLNNWCNKWRLSVNVSKSNIVHFRKKTDIKRVLLNLPWGLMICNI